MSKSNAPAVSMTFVAHKKVLQWDGLACQIAMKWWRRNPGTDLDELISSARAGMCRAVVSFDPARAKFQTYAGWWILHFVRLSVGQQVARGTHVPSRDGMKAVGVVNYADVVEWGEGDRPYDPFLARPEDSRHLELKGMWQRLTAALPFRLRRALKLRYIEGLTLAECGDRMGVSRERIRQMCERAFQLIRQKFPTEERALG